MNGKVNKQKVIAKYCIIMLMLLAVIIILFFWHTKHNTGNSENDNNTIEEDTASSDSIIERPQNYMLNGKMYPLVDSYRTIEYIPIRDFQTVDSMADIVVIGEFIDDATTVKNGENSYSTNTFQVINVLRGELSEEYITIAQDYYIDEGERLVARSGMTPMEKGSRWLYFLTRDEKKKAFLSVGQAAGRYPYLDLSIEKLKHEEYTMAELGIFDINEFFVYDEQTQSIYGNYSIYSEALKKYDITFK